MGWTYDGLAGGGCADDEGGDTIGVEFGGGRKEGLPVSVAVASVLTHTGALVTVNVTPGVMVTIVFERIDV